MTTLPKSCGVLPFIAVLFLWFLSNSPAATAQLQGRIAEQPVGIWYMRNITPVHMTEYFRKLSERLSIGETLLQKMQDERLQEMFSTAPEPVMGGAFYLVQGLLPSYEVISFQQVADEAEAERMLNGRRRQFGETATLTTLGDGCYRLSNQWTNRFPLPEGADESIYMHQASQTGAYRSQQAIVEEDGVRYVESSTGYESCFRVHDNMLYEASVEELFTMQLPASESLTRAIQGTNDLGLQLFFDRIPPGIRQLGWNMLNSGIGTQLQQRDDEPIESYNMRRSAGDLLLPLLQKVLFDVEQTEGWIRFAADNFRMVRGRLAFKARQNSGLTRQLQDLASGRSRFAPILNDGAALTLHSCVQLPPEAERLFSSVADYLNRDASLNSGDLGESLRGIAEALKVMGEQQRIEWLVKVGWSQASDGVIYGGLQVAEDSSLMTSLHQLLTNFLDAFPELSQLVSLTEEQGERLIQIRISEDIVTELKKNTSLRLTHLCLTMGNGCLWFAWGGENAVQMIRQSIDRCQQAGFAGRTPLLTAYLDGARWLSYPQDDPSGVGGLLSWLDANAPWFPPGPGPFQMMARGSGMEPMIERVRALGGDEHMRLVIDADESGLLISMEIGESVANYYLARLIATQDLMMRSAEQVQRQRAVEADAAAADSTNLPDTTPTP